MAAIRNRWRSACCLIYMARFGLVRGKADEKLLTPVLSREAFQDGTGEIARAALELGMAHRKLKYFASRI